MRSSFFKLVVLIVLLLLAPLGYFLGSTLDVPSTPLWTKKVEAESAQILGFVDGGKTILVSTAVYSPGELIGWDASTGNERFREKNYIPPALPEKDARTKSVDQHGLLNGGELSALSVSRFNDEGECLERQLLVSETRTGKLKYRTPLTVDGNPLNAVVCSRSADVIVTKQLSPASKATEFLVLEAETGKPQRVMSPAQVPQVELHEISPDGKVLVHIEIVPGVSGAFILSDVITGLALHKLDQPGTYRVQFHRDSQSFTAYWKLPFADQPDRFVQHQQYFVRDGNGYRPASAALELPASESTLSVPGWSIVTETIIPPDWKKKFHSLLGFPAVDYLEYRLHEPITGSLRGTIRRKPGSLIADEATVDGTLLAICDDDMQLSVWAMPPEMGPMYGTKGALLGLVPGLLWMILVLRRLKVGRNAS